MIDPPRSSPLVYGGVLMSVTVRKVVKLSLLHQTQTIPNFMNIAEMVDNENTRINKRTNKF